MPKPSVPWRLLFPLLALLLQGCATTSSTGTAGLRSLPKAHIELDAPELSATPRFAATPSLAGILSRGSRALGHVLQSALSFTGTRYRYGGSSPLTGFDCSGFVGYVFRESAGLKLPRASYQMANGAGRKLGRAELTPGDLVFFAQRKRIDHVGIYLGDQRFIHSPSSGGRVRTDSLTDKYWDRRFVIGKRVLDPASGAAARIAARIDSGSNPASAVGAAAASSAFGESGASAR